jgi:hypothetical protein
MGSDGVGETWGLVGWVSGGSMELDGDGDTVGGKGWSLMVG